MSAETIAAKIKPYKGQQMRSDTTYIFYFFTDEDAHELTTGWVSEKVDFEGLIPIGTFPSGDMLLARSSGVLRVLTHDEFSGWDSDVGIDEFIERVTALDATLEDEVYARNQIQ